MTVTRKAFRQQIATRSTLGVALTATHDGADTTHYRDDSDRTVGGDTTILTEGAPFVITSTSSGGPVWGETSRLSSTAIDPTGIITLARALTNAPDTAQTAEVWHPALYSIDRINDVAERVLTELCSFWHYTPLSLLNDGDMEAVPATAFTAKDSNTTAAKAALTFPNFWGTRYMAVTNASGANGYMYQAVPCTEDDKYRLHVIVQAATGEAEITVYDVDGTAAITLTGETSDDDSTPAEGGWSIQRFSFTTPSGCRSFQVRLGAVGASDVANYSAAMLWREDSHFLPFADRTRDRNRVTGFFRQIGGGTNEEDATDVRYSPMLGVRIVPVSGGLGAHFYSALGSGGPYFVRERRNYNAFAGASFLAKDGDTTNCPPEYLYAAGNYLLTEHFYFGEERRGKLPKPEKGENPWEQMLARLWARYRYYDRLYASDKETIEPVPVRIRR